MRFDTLSLFEMTNKRKLPGEILSLQFLVLVAYSSLAVLTLLPLFLEHIGGNPRQIGLLVGIFSFAAFISRPFGGWILSRYHAKSVLVAGLILTMGFTVLYLFIEEINWFIFFIRIFHGIGFSVVILAILLIAFQVVHEDQRAYAIGVVSTGFMLPLLIVPAMGEEIIERFGFSAFFLSAIFFAVIPLVFALLVRMRIPKDSEEESMGSIGFFRLLRQKKIFLIFLLTFVFEVGLSASLSFVPLLAVNDSPLRAGYFYTCLGVTAVFMRLIGGRWFPFWGNTRLLLPAFYFMAVGGVVVFLAFSNLVLALSGVIWGIGVGVLYPHLSALIIEGVSAREKGKVLSFFASSVDLGFALGPLLFGWISQSLGVRFAFIPLSAAVFLASTVLVLWGRTTLFNKDT
jgi:predicted MFS family arabinose efflux permease